MKLSDVQQKTNNLAYVQQTGKSDPVDKKQNPPKSESAATSEDRVELSAQSKEMQKLHDTLNMTPEMREERVREVKALIEKGEYRTDSDKIAGKMIREALLELNLS